jgi:hypothetical protein
MKRVLVSLLVALFVPVCFWLGGYNFDSRGIQALLCFVYTPIAFVMSYICPAWEH